MQLSQVLYSDRPAIHHADGRRISKAKYESLIEEGIRRGTYSAVHTRAVQLPGGRFKRWNYTCV